MNKLEDWNVVHRRVAAMATGLSILPMFFLIKDLQWQVLFFVLNVAFFGICHGALDHLRFHTDKTGQLILWRLLLFGLLYLGLAALVIFTWLHDPGPMLVSFLSVSCLHFAMDEDTDLPAVARLLWGVLPVLGPCFLHAKEVGQMFTFLTGSQVEFSMQLNVVLQFVGFVVVGLTVVSLSIGIVNAINQKSTKGLSMSISGLSLILCYIVLPPLLSFSIYFCWWHSLRQCLKLIAGLDAPDFQHGLIKFIKIALPLTLGSWSIALLIYFLYAKLGCAMVGGEQLFASQIRTVFYLLSALTVPHMFVEMFFSERQNLTQDLA